MLEENPWGNLLGWLRDKLKNSSSVAEYAKRQPFMSTKIEEEAKSDAVAGNGTPAANVAPKLLFDVRESAARLSVSVVSIRKLIRQNRLKRVPDFRKILISEAELQRFAAMTN